MDKYMLLKLISLCVFLILLIYAPIWLTWVFIMYLLLRLIIFVLPTKGNDTSIVGKESALFVLDLQKCNSKNKNDFIKRVNKEIKIAKDLDYNIIYIKNVFEYYDILFSLFTMGGGFLKGSGDTEFADKLNIKSENIFIKHNQDAFTNKELSSFLVNNDIGDIYISGQDARACVLKTAVGAKNRGYNVKIIRNAINPNDNSIINKIESKNIKVINSLKDNR
ncbi:isochorismatase family cysteine hydrolase [uncultured Anaerofustis sp.]|uniref:isochorismatase family cysteine hydrolase n=1 Tax=uncultured Anaerofustis sp. TaxID=904996 RepID=UPI0025FDE011|nr:isochorismatase family cysteine hydrolase [uncultured Anaerofustis sp.]